MSLLFGSPDRRLEQKNSAKMEESNRLLQKKLRDANQALLFLASILDEHHLMRPEYQKKLKSIFESSETPVQLTGGVNSGEGELL